jgi:hypothetical protein
MYGGMPSVGGFGNNTEYEIGAAEAAEAAHCILGSLVKLHSSSDTRPFAIEKGHIKEEMGIIERSMKEYSKDLYLMRVFKGQYAEQTIQSMLKAAPVLEKKAKQAKGKLSKDLPKEIKELADKAYEFLIVLAQNVELTAKRLNHKYKMTGKLGADNSMDAKKLNAYKQPAVIKATKELRKKANAFIALSDDGTLTNPYPPKKKPLEIINVEVPPGETLQSISKMMNKNPELAVDDILDLLKMK